MAVIPVKEFIDGLRTIPEDRFDPVNVYEFAKKHPLDEESIRKYLFFSKKHYTRNLIFKNDLFELLAICWEIGQSSSIHNHQDQNCWMLVPIGRLRVQNFEMIEGDEGTKDCLLKPTETFEINRSNPCAVDPKHPIHQVLNSPEFNAPAVSLHIYSKPFDRCLVYSLSNGKYNEVSLSYASEYGELCPGVQLCYETL